jgi:Ca2+-binding RTX toxin-like protein
VIGVNETRMGSRSIGRGHQGKRISRAAVGAATLALLMALGLAMLALAAPAQVLAGQWQTRAASPTNRQEVSYVQAGGKFYLAGGNTRGLHERYDPATDSWSTVAPLPVPDSSKLDHIQGVELGGLIYYIGGLLKWPDVHDSAVRIYNPTTNTFSQGTPMPDGRGRGAGGVAVHDGKIYYAGGVHNGDAVPWFDVYDPATNNWEQLPNMPRARDHFHAVVVDGKFYAIGGRNGAINATTPKVDVYDLTQGAGGSWQTLNTELPTPRGGFAAAALGQEILIIGGEGGGNSYNTVEAYDTVANSWRTLAPMPTARHGIQAAVCNGGIYVAAGGKTQGGGNPTNVHEAFFLNGSTTCGAQTEPPPGGCTITGTSANDTLTGTSGNDVICGGGGNDTIKGAGGNDTIKGEGGADKLFGEAGDDALDGGTGNDTADFSGSLASVTASLASGTATGEGSDTLLGVDSLIGSSKVDALSGNGGANTINGGGANDTIEGLGGNDKLTGSGGNDTLRGGAGNDSVVGSGGADSLFGDDGDDAVNSKDNVSGNDSLDGGTHVNGDTAVTDATEKSIVGFP